MYLKSSLSGPINFIYIIYEAIKKKSLHKDGLA